MTVPSEFSSIVWNSFIAFERKFSDKSFFGFGSVSRTSFFVTLYSLAGPGKRQVPSPLLLPVMLLKLALTLANQSVTASATC